MQFIANPTQIVSYCRKLLPVAQVPRELTGNFNCEHYNNHFAHPSTHSTTLRAGFAQWLPPVVFAYCPDPLIDGCP